MSTFHDVFSQILPDYEPISQRPRSITDFPEWVACPLDKRDALEDQIRTKEAKKQYKAQDSNTGDIYLVQNPWVWDWKPATEQSHPVVIPKKKLAYKFNDAKKALSFGHGEKKNKKDIKWGG